MNKKSLFSIAFLITGFAVSGCRTDVETNVNIKVNANAQTANTMNANADMGTANAATPNANVIAVATPNTADTTQNAETAQISAVVEAYYNALQTKNEAALRNTQSADALKEIQAQMNKLNEKSLVTYTLDFDAPPSKPFQIRRVNVQGNMAIAEIFNPDTQGVLSVKFVKENNLWKYASPSEQKQVVFSGKK